MLGCFRPLDGNNGSAFVCCLFDFAFFIPTERASDCGSIGWRTLSVDVVAWRGVAWHGMAWLGCNKHGNKMEFHTSQ